ncbi:MAG: ferrochelatase [Alphaproteobacteria bacterium]|nr:ferrochelatase [Alphaproteobacteria bacterium]
MSERIAVVLFNLGGPDGPADVRPFLQNLFSDPAIIRSPAPVRWFLSRLISMSRKKSAVANYAKMGGGSPLLPETRKQADALDAELARRGLEAKCFIAMRYWKPFAPETVAAVKAWGATRVVLLPLYPQFSTTTTASSLKSWADAGGLSAATVCCYPTAPKFIEAHARKILAAWEAADRPGNVRLLLSAHGLPEMIVKAGDPYQWQVEQTAAALRPLLPTDWEIEICYQSRVGRLVWIGPPTDECVTRAAADGKSILVCPIAFVSEHIETLVELDEDYRHVAEAAGAITYVRVPALGVDAGFIETLADLTVSALNDSDASVRSHCGGRICPAGWRDCPNRRPAARLDAA